MKTFLLHHNFEIESRDSVFWHWKKFSCLGTLSSYNLKKIWHNCWSARFFLLSWKELFKFSCSSKGFLDKEFSCLRSTQFFQPKFDFSIRESLENGLSCHDFKVEFFWQIILLLKKCFILELTTLSWSFNTEIKYELF